MPRPEWPDDRPVEQLLTDRQRRHQHSGYNDNNNNNNNKNNNNNNNNNNDNNNNNNDNYIIITRPGCFCAKDCLDSVEMYKWWYTFTCTGGGVL